ncbi:pyridoxamine 5'-phosphate oxidase family protein [Halobacteria archaeon AArc-dxtr1]|nr:pyridoxamine 5'-phosphate oxidase family protein [Halobacteria archaeon AArc-dxtr1]
MAAVMDRSMIDELLTREGTGVLSLSDAGDTYAIPESFGYDGENVYFQFVVVDDSRKLAFAETTDTATLTVYTEEPAESVIVSGSLERVPEAAHSCAAAAIADNADIPTLNVFPDASVEELSMRFYRLVPDDLSGRTFTNAGLKPFDA